METIVYRQGAAVPLTRGERTGGVSISAAEVRLAESPEESMAFHPEIFYPRLLEKEMIVWEHWLPTTSRYARDNCKFPSDVASALTRLHAPQEVIEEFSWACKTELFDTYEIRTPQRRDLRDPLLIGQHEGKRYRIALWGESLRPFAEITALVEQSLDLRDRAAWWHRRIIAGGTLLGLGLGVWLGSQTSVDGDPVGMGVLLALLSFAFTWLCSRVYTPENRQHTFLDRYRC